ncbi:MAG: hypothetical protein ABID64_00600 [Nitrospirota bacterium]
MKTKILALLFLVALMGVQAQFIAYAAEPPSISSPLAEDDTTPPALGGDEDDTTPPALGGDEDDTTPPDLGTGGGSPLPTDSSPSVTTDETSESSESTSIISETGPEVAFLLIPSLILGYAYKKKK